MQHPASAALPPLSLYQERRLHLARQLGAGGIALIPTAPEQVRNRDAHFPYRADSYFYYLTGFEEPNAWLLVEASGHSTLLCQPKNLEREIWDGYRLGPDAAPAALGVQSAYSVDELHTRLPELLANTTTVYYPFATHSGLPQQVENWLVQVRSRARAGVRAPDTVRDACALLDEMRLIKDAHEQATMLRAGQISAQAHVRAMQTSARLLRAGQDAREYHLEAELLHTFRQHGSQAPAYTSIVAAGSNACVLHYRAGNAPLKSGELVLIDAGCELHGYASDITRTFPANGRFSSAQRAVYEVVLAAQEAAISATHSGARFNAVHHAALHELVHGLLQLGILQADKVGSVEDAIASKAYTPFYMHRTSHWLGLDVHDVGSYTEPGEAPQGSTDTSTHNTSAHDTSRILRPGMVITIEPGLYIRPAENVPEAYHHIGIRIEDDALITPTSCELLTRAVPVAANEIESLMAD